MSIAQDVARAVYVEGAIIAPVALGLGDPVPNAPLPVHRHVPDTGTVLSERHVMGIRWVVVPCSVCGEPLPERQA